LFQFISFALYVRVLVSYQSVSVKVVFLVPGCVAEICSDVGRRTTGLAMKRSLGARAGLGAYSFTQNITKMQQITSFSHP